MQTLRHAPFPSSSPSHRLLSLLDPLEPPAYPSSLCPSSGLLLALLSPMETLHHSPLPLFCPSSHLLLSLLDSLEPPSCPSFLSSRSLSAALAPLERPHLSVILSFWLPGKAEQTCLNIEI